MPRPVRKSLFAAAAFLVALPAGASERPPSSPTQDVDITYDVTLAPKQKIRERVRWLAGERLERIDGPKSTTILNHKKEEITLVTPGDRTFRVLAGRPRQPLEPADEVTPTRGDAAVVAGKACVEWSWVEDDEAHMACATPDGVLLRLTVGGEDVRVARSVTYVRQKPELFEVPAGYTAALAPEGSPGE